MCWKTSIRMRTRAVLRDARGGDGLARVIHARVNMSTCLLHRPLPLAVLDALEGLLDPLSGVGAHVVDQAVPIVLPSVVRVELRHGLRLSGVRVSLLLAERTAPVCSGLRRCGSVPAPARPVTSMCSIPPGFLFHLALKQLDGFLQHRIPPLTKIVSGIDDSDMWLHSDSFQVLPTCIEVLLE